MSNYQDMFDKLKSSNKYEENARLLEVLLNSFKRGNKVNKDDLMAIKAFVFDEMNKLLTVLPSVETYRAKDEIFYYEDKLLGLFMFINTNKVEISDDEFNTVKTLINAVSEMQVLENSVNDLFKLNKIERSDVEKVIEIAKPLTDEYQKGLFFQGLLNYAKDVNKFTKDAKAAVADYISSEIERMLKKGDLNADEINNLEIASDVCKHFITDKILTLLQQVLTLKHNNIRYYAIVTLIENNIAVPTEVIAEMAQDLVYANLLYFSLAKHGKADIFPAEFTDHAYLAKSDMVHWLTYPTELGKVPDEISLLGDVKVKGEKYYIFKYKSDSENLSDDLTNEWLIGWSSEDGGTFSNFDKLSDYECKKPQKTLKVIKKKLIC